MSVTFYNSLSIFLKHILLVKFQREKKKKKFLSFNLITALFNVDYDELSCAEREGGELENIANKCYIAQTAILPVPSSIREPSSSSSA